MFYDPMRVLFLHLFHYHYSRFLWTSLRCLRTSEFVCLKTSSKMKNKDYTVRLIVETKRNIYIHAHAPFPGLVEVQTFTYTLTFLAW